MITFFTLLSWAAIGFLLDAIGIFDCDESEESSVSLAHPSASGRSPQMILSGFPDKVAH